MKLFSYLVALSLVASAAGAHAQSAHDIAEARTIYRQANTKPNTIALRADLAKHTSGFFGDGTFQPGALRTFDGRYRPVQGLRYHAGLRLLEAQDSIDLDSTHLWPVGSLRGFDLGEAGGKGAEAPRRFRPRLVKEGTIGTRREFVEVLTAVDAGPLLLAWLYSSGADAAAGRLSLAPLLLVGSGTEPDEPLRPFDLSQAAVLRLFGKRDDDMRKFAEAQHLKYDQPADVARIIDHYNRVAVVK
ncbi:hypothetical protein [Hymenobacter negativus]|uniref:Uncharacterized protein n=1 Tax=Hymenobacter negativus TaxID=2795026 RepID=A0ABS3QMF7_9BACT|nr:hypothetical protein [Hymenobacter negativus]MBO2012276.1 hypothetical protein [Hymenobacter negativus]